MQYLIASALTIVVVSVFSCLQLGVAADAMDTITSERPAPAIDSLDNLRWKNRLLILFNDAADSDVLPLLERLRAGIEERDLIWFVVTAEEIETNLPNGLSDKIHSELSMLKATSTDSRILVGKDGGIKLSIDTLDMDTIFTTIDAMPMRQQEMRVR
jgi:hypothetical protein